VDTLWVTVNSENNTVLIGDINPVALDPSPGCEDVTILRVFHDAARIEVSGTVRKFTQLDIDGLGAVTLGSVSIDDGALPSSVCDLLVSGTNIEVDIGDIAVDTVAGTALTIDVQVGASGHPDAFATISEISQVGTGGASLTFDGTGVGSVKFGSATEPVHFFLTRMYPTAVTSFLTSFTSGTGADSVTLTSLPGALDIAVALGGGDDSFFTYTEIGSTSTINTGAGADDVRLLAGSLTQADIDLGTDAASISIEDTFDGDLDCAVEAFCTYSEGLSAPSVVGDCSCVESA
jgi:hypothetical protein